MRSGGRGTGVLGEGEAEGSGQLVVRLADVRVSLLGLVLPLRASAELRVAPPG